MRVRRARLVWALGVIVFASTPAFGGDPEDPIVIDGSSTVFRISRAAQESYKKLHPNTNVVVDIHGTGGGFNNYFAGQCDIIDASRDATETEAANANDAKNAWTRYLVGYDGITVVVNRKNTWVNSLTTAQLKALFAPGSKIMTWRDLDPKWPARNIRLFTPDNASGTHEYFCEEIIDKKLKSQRRDVQANSDDNFLVKGVAGSANALGYFGYAYYAANKDLLKAVPIQDGPAAKPVAPTPETILSKDYRPLSRPLYIFARKSAMGRPEFADFVKHYLENVAVFAAKGGYVAPTREDAAANAKAFDASMKAAVR